MALTEEQINDKIEVVNSGSWSCVQVRTATVIKRDDVEISRNFHRHVVMPDADLSAEDADVSAICTTVFTQDCKDAYAAHMASQVDAP
jgi:predicted metal-dependent TIM-barrel fold hydrolase